MDGKRVEEIQRGVAAAVSIVLPQKKGDVGVMLRTPHVDGDMIHAYFGQRHRVGSAAVLEKIAREGVSVIIRPGGDLVSELA